MSSVLHAKLFALRRFVRNVAHSEDACGRARLLLATEEGPIACVGLEDELVTQYLSRYSGMKALSASTDLIAALSGDRQRLILWQTWNNRQPAADLFVTALTKHRAADVAVG